MSFTQTQFIFLFLPFFLLLYGVLPPKCQKPVLIIGGLIFYSIGQNKLVLYLIASMLINYGLHRWLVSMKKNTALLVVTIVLNAGLLVYCKATGNLPLGVSFYTFQVISVQIDARYKKQKAIDFFAILCCFPKLVMGPLVRIDDFKEAFARAEKGYLLKAEGMESGLKLFTVGLGLKMILADSLGYLVNGIHVSGVYGITTAVAWMGAIAYSMELYFDFWGYSLMAVGLGKMLGLPIPENFNEPYCAKTISEFWRRWHITLGAWFRDYIYIPMGGSKKGVLRQMLALFTVWLVTGVWHGWGINFLIWSMFLLLFIMLEKFTPIGKLSKTKVAGRIYVAVVMLFAWTIFQMDSPVKLGEYLKVMFGIYSEKAVLSSGQFMRYVKTYWYVLAGGLLFMTPFPRWFYNKFSKKHWFILILLLILALSLHLIVKGSGSNFLYFAF